MRMQPKKIIYAAAASLFSILIAVIAIEIVGINFLFTGKRLYFVNDVDHRVKGGTRPDVNSDGLRLAVEATEFRDEDVNIIFLGDSFIWGGGLTRDEAIPFLLQEKARELHPEKRINIANFGWVSSSPLLSYRQLKEIGRKYKPDIVLLAIDMTDIHDDMKYLRLLERDGLYRLLSTVPITFWISRKVFSVVGPLNFFYESLYGYPVNKYFISSRPLEETLPYFSTMRSNIDSIHSYSVNELDARFILFVFPRSYQYSDREAPNSWEQGLYENLGPYAHEPFKYFDQMRDEVDYPIHSLLSDFETTTVFPTCFDDDPHWNQDGVQVALDAIVRHCLEDGCFD